MKNKPRTKGPLVVDVERDLRKHMREITHRLNDNPDLARLVLINPILVLEDLGVVVSKDVKTHIMDALRFPPSLVKRRNELAQEVQRELVALNINHTLPLTNQQRAALVYRTLQIPPLEEENGKVDTLSINQLRAYKDKHPLLYKLSEYERYSKGALIFYPRSIYEKYKHGEKKLHWVNAIRFKT